MLLHPATVKRGVVTYEDRAASGTLPGGVGRGPEPAP
jgi:hypothetical protein